MHYLFTVPKSAIMIVMFLIIFPTRRKGIRAAAELIIGTAVTSAALLLMADASLYVGEFAAIAVTAAVCLYIFNIRWQNALMITLLGSYELMTCNIIAENLSAIIPNDRLSEAAAIGSLQYFFLCMPAKLIAAAVVVVSALLLRRLDFNASPKYSPIFDIILVLLSFTNFFYEDMTSAAASTLDRTQIIIMCLSNMAAAILALVLFFKLCRYFSAEEKLGCSKLKIDFLEQQLRQQKNAEKAIRTVKHDMLNHLSALDYLSKKGDANRFDSYMGTLASRVSVSFGTTFTGIQMLDAVLSIKAKAAEDNNIDMKINSLGVKHYPAASEYDICSIFSNLLDNAIEGAISADTDSRKIIADISESADCLNVRITNHYGKNNIFASGMRHINNSLGIDIARSAAEENKGMLECTAEDGVFTSIVILPMSEKTTESL